MTEHQDKDTRREQVLDAACKLFTDKGFESSSVDDIAREAGLSKGAIYWYFKSKLEILFALTDRYMHESQSEIVRLASTTELGPEALYKSHRFYLREMRDYPVRDKLMQQLVSLSGQYSQIRDRIALYHREWDTTVSELLERGVRDGDFRPMNTLAVARAINALHHGAMVHAQMDATIDPVEVIEIATKLFYDALIIAAPTGAKGSGG